MWLTIVDHGLIDGVSGLVGEDAGRQARNNFGALSTSFRRTIKETSRKKKQYVGFLGTPQQIIIHQIIVPVKVQLVLHVFEQSADHRRQVDHMRWFVFFKERFCIRHRSLTITLSTHIVERKSGREVT